MVLLLNFGKNFNAIIFIEFQEQLEQLNQLFALNSTNTEPHTLLHVS